ncbi:ArsA family ATPase [bacterium]|nr:ArsA family ATPase [bacterium]
MNSSQQLYFVTGKGGVGKTVVSTAMALNYARDGHRTLLLELSSDSAFKYYINESISFEPKQVEENLFVAKWSGKDCLSQYVKHITGLNKITDMFLNHSAMSSLVEVAPGLNEISILGKLTSEMRNVGIPLNYDKIVIDCFSTGHFLALLNAPKGLSEIIKFGPMGENTSQILKILKDPKKCNYVVVSLAEELPFDETSELCSKLTESWNTNIKIVINKVYNPVPLDGDTELEKKAKQFFDEKVTLQSKWIEKFKSEYQNIYSCPFIFKSKPKVLIEKIAAEMNYE